MCDRLLVELGSRLRCGISDESVAAREREGTFVILLRGSMLSLDTRCSGSRELLWLVSGRLRGSASPGLRRVEVCLMGLGADGPPSFLLTRDAISGMRGV